MHTLITLAGVITAVSAVVTIPMHQNQDFQNQDSSKNTSTVTKTVTRSNFEFGPEAETATVNNPFLSLSDHSLLDHSLLDHNDNAKLTKSDAPNVSLTKATESTDFISAINAHEDLLDELNFTDVTVFRNNASNELFSKLRTWAIEDPLAALDWLANTATYTQKHELELFILHSIIDHHPVAAYNIRSALVLPDSHILVNRKYAESLAKIDASSAFEWAMQLDDSESKLSALYGVSALWAREDHDSLLARITALTDQEVNQQLFDSVAYVIAADLVSNDPMDALAWANTLNAKQQHAALPAVFSNWVQGNPEQQQAARTWLQQQPDSPTKLVMQKTDFWRSLSEDLDYALTIFTESLKNTQYADSLVYSITGVISQQRPNEVDLFISTLDDPRLIKSAVAAKREQLMYRNPEEFLSLHDTLENNERIEFLATVLFKLERLKPELVAQWLEAHPISIQDVDRVNAQIEQYAIAEHGC